MERVISRWLDDNHVEYVGENQTAPSGGRLEYDFILTGAVPTFIEIKHSHFGNTELSEALARTAVAAFGRCRFLLVVVGEASEAWAKASEVTSATFFFDPAEVDIMPPDHADSAIDRAAKTFVDDMMASLMQVPILGHSSRDSGNGLPLEELSKWQDRLTPIEALFPADPLNALKTVAASFRTIVGSSDSVENVVDHELAQLKDEYRSGHYTSCALRLGRCLELVVYAFAHKLGISPSTGKFRTLLAVEDKQRALTGRMADLAEADPVRDNDHYRTKRLQLRDAIIELLSSLGTVLSQLDDVAKEDREVRGPDNLQAILRRALRHLGDGPGAAEAKGRLGRLLSSDRASEIIALRNAAAHGDPDLARREVSQDEVTEQLFAVADYIQELAVVIESSRRLED